MSVETQLLQKQISIFKQSLKFQEAAAGVVIQRVPSAYLYRILRPLIDARAAAPNEREANRIRAMDHCPDRRDPLVHAIYNMDETSRVRDQGRGHALVRRGHRLRAHLRRRLGQRVSLPGVEDHVRHGREATARSRARRRDDRLQVGERTSNFSTDAASTGRDDARLAPYSPIGSICTSTRCAPWEAAASGGSSSCTRTATR